jgi:hypothetical protein
MKKNENNLHKTLNNTHYTHNKKGALSPLIIYTHYTHYLFITYIVTSKPNLISVADGVVHIIFAFHL